MVAAGTFQRPQDLLVEDLGARPAGDLEGHAKLRALHQPTELEDPVLPQHRGEVVEVEIFGPAGKMFKATSNDEGMFSVTLDIFKEGGGKSTAEEFGVPFLGALPFDPGFVRGGDDGVHRIVSDPDGASSKAFAKVVQAIQEHLQSGDQKGLEII